MFTGIIEEIGTVQQVRSEQSVRTLEIKAQNILVDMHIGDSISVNGACLTVIDFTDSSFSVQVIKGTENKTYLGSVQRNTEVNLERAMTILSSKKVGNKVHLESDVLFKYVENIMNQNQSQLTEEKLRAFGF